MMKKLNLLLIYMLLNINPVFAQTPVSETERIVEHHMTAGNNRDLDEVLFDYADDAILIAPGGVVHKGKPAIQASFEQLIAQDQDSVISADLKIFEGEVGYVLWTMNAGQNNSVMGTDTFIVRDGKIVVQTVTIFTPAPAQSSP